MNRLPSPRVFSIVATFVVLLPVLCTAQTINGDGALVDKPDGAKVAALKAGTPASVLKRQGFWVQVQAASKTGWVRLNQLGFGGASGIVALDTGRAAAGNIVSTSVARGLTAKDLLNGKPDLGAVARMDAWVPNSASVDKFSADGGVAPVNLTVTLKVIPAAKAARKSSQADSDEE
jgi:hypothetical protein